MTIFSSPPESKPKAFPQSQIRQLLVLLAVSVIPVFALAANSPTERTVLRVNMFPYLPSVSPPDFTAFVARVKAEFTAEHPNIDLELHIDPTDDFYNTSSVTGWLAGEGTYDLVESDMLLLGDLVKSGAIQPWGNVQQTDWESPCSQAVQIGGQIFGEPHWLCGYFIFTRDPAIAKADTGNALIDAPQVGAVERTKLGRDGRVNAVLVRSADRSRIQKSARLWREPEAARLEQRLHPERQVWVHVDYHGYRKAYRDFGMPAIPDGWFLDHVQNRRAVRLRGYSHPYLRLCPVSHEVNSSGGHVTGGEGMETAFIADLVSYSPAIQEEVAKALRHPVQYADPMDLTKMLNVAPGTFTLDGVRDLQGLFYP